MTKEQHQADHQAHTDRLPSGGGPSTMAEFFDALADAFPSDPPSLTVYDEIEDLPSPEEVERLKSSPLPKNVIRAGTGPGSGWLPLDFGGKVWERVKRRRGLKLLDWKCSQCGGKGDYTDFPVFVVDAHLLASLAAQTTRPPLPCPDCGEPLGGES